jgi:chromosome segregation ATPase
MKSHPFVLFSFAATAAFAISLAAAPAAADKLHERYVTGLAIIADTQAATARMGRTLEVIENGADAQASRVTSMESRLFSVKQSTERLERESESLGATTKNLLDQKIRIEARFTSLERALNDDRTLLTKSTEIISALLASAEKSGSNIERTIAEQTTAELKQHAGVLRAIADQLAQTRQRIGLERTLFEGLQPRLGTTGADLKAVSGELAAAGDRIATQRTALTTLRSALDRDRANLAGPYVAFGIAIEGYRVVQVDVLRRWLLDGPPAVEIPALSINDIIESSLPSAGKGRYAAHVESPNAVAFAEDPNTQLSSRSASASIAEPSDAGANNQISVEFTQLNRRARWSLAMLQRLEAFAGESLMEAENWTEAATNWRSELTNMNRAIADLRGTLASLQLEQDMIAATIKLITKQTDDTSGSVAETAKRIASQTTQLTSLTAELKRLSAD